MLLLLFKAQQRNALYLSFDCTVLQEDENVFHWQFNEHETGNQICPETEETNDLFMLNFSIILKQTYRFNIICQQSKNICFRFTEGAESIKSVGKKYYYSQIIDVFPDRITKFFKMDENLKEEIQSINFNQGDFIEIRLESASPKIIQFSNITTQVDISIEMENSCIFADLFLEIFLPEEGDSVQLIRT